MRLTKSDSRKTEKNVLSRFPPFEPRSANSDFSGCVAVCGYCCPTGKDEIFESTNKTIKKEYPNWDIDVDSVFVSGVIHATMKYLQ